MEKPVAPQGNIAIPNLNFSLIPWDIKNGTAKPLFNGAIAKVGTYVVGLLEDNGNSKVLKIHVYSGIPKITNEVEHKRMFGGSNAGDDIETPIVIPKLQVEGNNMGKGKKVEEQGSSPRFSVPAIGFGEWRDQKKETQKNDYYMWSFL